MKRLLYQLLVLSLLVTPIFGQTSSPSAEEIKTREIITDWVKGLRSQRNDPALEKDIRKWWQGPDPANKPDPILRIIYLQPNYAIERNQYGEVLRKHVDTLILWSSKDRNKCHIQWRSFGYDSLGGGAFSDEMQGFMKREFIGFDYYRVNLNLPGNTQIQTGVHYEVNCGGLAK